jgi:hypothetical protein
MRERTNGGPPASIAFVFGSGRLRIWHWILLLLALPVFWFADWFARFEPGAGPQGGEAVFFLMLVHMLAYLIATVVSAAIQARRAGGSLAQRCLLRPTLMVGAAIVAFGAILFASDIGTAIDATPAIRWSAALLAAAALLLIYVANWWALALARKG